MGVREPHCWNEWVGLSQVGLSARLAPPKIARGGKETTAIFQSFGFVNRFLAGIVKGIFDTCSVCCSAPSAFSATIQPYAYVLGIENGLLASSARACSHLARQAFGGWESSEYVGVEARRARARRAEGRNAKSAHVRFGC